MWEYEHSVETVVGPEILWRHWSDVAGRPAWNASIEKIEVDGPTSGPAADQVGPELGPAITADFPEVLDALVRVAQG
jgi:hypothetical protein